MADRVRRRVVVRGHVQGVFFRDTTREEAERHGVAGWASNRPDGSVEVVLEGAPSAVDGVLEFLRAGPPRARVEQVDVAPQEPEGLTAFTIR